MQLGMEVTVCTENNLFYICNQEWESNYTLFDIHQYDG